MKVTYFEICGNKSIYMSLLQLLNCLEHQNHVDIKGIRVFRGGHWVTSDHTAGAVSELQ